MKSRTSLTLMEQVVMLLVFALASALCIQVFVYADQTSRSQRDTEQAVLLAQNTAETLKACRNIELAAEQLGGDIQQTMWSAYYYEDLSPAPDRESAFYHVDALPQGSDVTGLGRANIDVFRYDGNEPLFSLSVAWQEVSGNA